jgi:hypothetical protein
MTIPIRLILYISYLASLPAPFKAIARDIFVLFHIG